MQRIIIAILMLFAPLLGANAKNEKEPKTIDLSQYELTFDEAFDDELDISAWGPGTRWIAHTPWRGDFGDSRFVHPRPGFPFVVEDGLLRIEARKGKDGVWRSGLLASVDGAWNGFAQKFGYFEMRAKLPKGSGLWPAFWLIGLDRSSHTSEIDVLEHYGHKPGQFSSGVKVWDRKNPKNSENYGTQTLVPDGSLYSKFNAYGVAIDAEWIRMFFNRVEVWRIKTPPAHRQPMFILLNLALGPGWPIDKTPNPSYMWVDYVRAWKLKS